MFRFEFENIVIDLQEKNMVEIENKYVYVIHVHLFPNFYYGNFIFFTMLHSMRTDVGLPMT